jgi:hypothetical protein
VWPPGDTGHDPIGPGDSIGPGDPLPDQHRITTDDHTDQTSFAHRDGRSEHGNHCSTDKFPHANARTDRHADADRHPDPNERADTDSPAN